MADTEVFQPTDAKIGGAAGTDVGKMTDFTVGETANLIGRKGDGALYPTYHITEGKDCTWSLTALDAGALIPLAMGSKLATATTISVRTPNGGSGTISIAGSNVAGYSIGGGYAGGTVTINGVGTSADGTTSPLSYA